jgi:UDP-3-O-[3-hydroxymyristoyl] glucosamine N-acyltransferase
MHHTISEIAAALGAEMAGNGALRVSGVGEPSAARADQLAVAMSPVFAADLPKGEARAAILWEGADWRAMGLDAAIFAPRARLALSRLTRFLAPGDGLAAEVHPTAIFDPTATVHPDCGIGPFTVIGPGVTLGQGTRIGAHVSIGAGANIGVGARIFDGVRIGPRVTLGDRVILQPGVVIGGDGFSFVTETPSNPERAKATGGAETLTPPEKPEWHKIESLGGVAIGDDVEIGANSTVDAGTIRPTRIGNGTKIDNLVQVGHNVIIGEHCLLCAQVGVAGSTRIGDRVVLGGQSGVADHVTIGADVVTGGATVVLNSVPAGRVLLGYPAQRMDRALSLVKTLRRLSRGTGQKRVSNTDASD